MKKDLNELKDSDKNKKLIQLWLEQNPEKTEEDFIELLTQINTAFNKFNDWADIEIDKIENHIKENNDL